MFDTLGKEALAQIAEARTLASLEQVRIDLIGKKGSVTSLMIKMRELPPEEKPSFGAKVNLLKELCEKAIADKKAFLESEEMNRRLASEGIDVTVPGRKLSLGSKHPISHFIDEALDILISLGFAPQVSDEVESSYYNYEGLNFEKDHPARDMQDTFYLDSQMLLRSHNTTIWQHLFVKEKPPIRVANFGKCFRNETVSARSHVHFHQIDILYVDRNVSFADLLGTMKLFFTKLFHQEVELRLRPSYFPFVEPGVEVDVRCLFCKGCGCQLCKKTGWLEICGAGLVHPNCLKEGGIDPEVYSGFAWGMGVERTLMLRYGIDDIRLFWNNDKRFLEQFTAL